VNDLAAMLAAQGAAADPAASAWVAASAGTGKTHVLTNRVLRLLLDGSGPERILCLTFTKAAAAEMSNRISGLLRAWTAFDDATLAALIDDAGRSPDGAYIDSIAVSPGRHLVLPSGSIAHFGNHSCDPTMWHEGAYDLVARRAIETDEELTVDYGTNSAAQGFAMPCRCGAAWCRGVVSSDGMRNV